MGGCSSSETVSPAPKQVEVSSARYQEEKASQSSPLRPAGRKKRQSFVVAAIQRTTSTSDTTKLNGKSAYIVLGGPGSGKDTQCTMLAAELGFVHVSTGQLLREDIKKNNTELNCKLEHRMQKGKLVPTDIVLVLLKSALLKEADTTKGFLIQGYPVNLEQAQKFETEVMPVELVINLEVERETMKQRMFKRGVRNRRVDDTMEVIERRIAIFCDHIEPVLAHYDQQDKLHSVSGEGTIDEVYANILGIVKHVRTIPE